MTKNVTRMPQKEAEYTPKPDREEYLVGLITEMLPDTLHQRLRALQRGAEVRVLRDYDQLVHAVEAEMTFQRKIKDGSMTKNVENWKFKSKKEIEKLKTSVLIEEWGHLTASITLFHQNRLPWTDEMFWTFVVLSSEIAIRAEKAISGPVKNTLC